MEMETARKTLAFPFFSYLQVEVCCDVNFSYTDILDTYQASLPDCTFHVSCEFTY